MADETKSWITKKKKYITKKKKKTDWIKKKEKPETVHSATDIKVHRKPHSSDEGRTASINRVMDRFKEGTYKAANYGDKSMQKQWKAESAAIKAKKEKKSWITKKKKKDYTNQ